MCDEYKSFTLVFPVQDGKVVVGHRIAVKSRDRGVKIPGIEDDQHVINQVVYINPYPGVFNRITVLVLTFQGEIVTVGCKATVAPVVELLP